MVAAAGLLMATGPQDKDVGGSSDKIPPQDPQQLPSDGKTPAAPKLKFENFAEGKLGEHYDKHVIERAEWGKDAIMSVTKYFNKARELINSPIGGDIEGFVSKNGFTFRYNIKTNGKVNTEVQH
jgi:hypothetical protein